MRIKKNIARKILLACLLGLSLAIRLSAQDCTDENLLPNGDFSLSFIGGDGLQKPTDFKFRTGDGICTIHQMDTGDQCISGDCIKFYNGSKIKKSAYYYGFHKIGASDFLPCKPNFGTAFLPVEPSAEYRFSFWYKTNMTSSSKGVFAQIVFSREGEEIGNVQTAYQQSTNKDWTEMSVSGVVPNTVDEVFVGIYFNGSGTAWIDNAALICTKAAIGHNLDFEKHTIDDNLPDYYSINTNEADCHLLENDPKMTYLGNHAAKFDPSNAMEPCFYELKPSADGSGNAAILVEAGEHYTITGFCRAAEDSQSDDFTLSALFNCSPPNNTIDCQPSVSNKGSTHWKEMSLNVTVPVGVTGMTPIIEYNGTAMAWFDHMAITRGAETTPGINTNSCPANASMNALTAPNHLKPALSEALLKDKFLDFHEGTKDMNGIDNMDGMEDNFELDEDYPGTWGPGDGCSKTLVRMSANAAIGYLNAYCVIPDPVYLDRACAALNRLQADQQTSGSNNGSFLRYTDCLGIDGPIAGLYEGSIACVAFLKAYDMFGVAEYKNKAKLHVDYLLDVPANANANYTGFGLWAIAEYLKVATENEVEAYLCKALEYFDALHTFQLDSGMWMDEHNQEIHYHSIITRGLVNLLAVLPSDHPKYSVVRHVTYRALNHISYNILAPGNVKKIPCTNAQMNSGFPIEAMIMAKQYLNLPASDQINLDKSIDLLTNGLGAASYKLDLISGHGFASLGLFLNLYFNKNDIPCTAPFDLLCLQEEPLLRSNTPKTNFTIYPNPARQSIRITGTGTFEIFDLSGKLILQNLSSGIVDLSNFKAGVYFVRNGEVVQKFILIP